MSAPTQQQIQTWQSFKGMSKRLDLEIRATGERIKQLQTVHAFKRANNLPVHFDPLIVSGEARQIWARNERLKRAIEQVELGHFGLRFRGSDLDIMAPAGTSADQIAPYQLGVVWPVIIIGVVVVYAVVEIWADLRQRNHDLYEKASNLVETADAQLCADPQSQTCIDWQNAKSSNNFDEQSRTIGGLFEEAEQWPDKIKSAASWFTGGVAVVAVLVAGYLLWQKKER